ncbi:MAG: nucleotidyltransferase domain-containing protein [Thermoproteota archaeon]
MRNQMPKMAEAVKKLLPDSRIYVFGSAVKHEVVGGSDLDILVVSKKHSEEQH